MPTRAEAAINRATVDGGGIRVFNKPRRGAEERPRIVPQFRLTPTTGGYFMEEALSGGKFWLPRAYMLTASEIGADDIPAHVWEERDEMAKEQAAAFEVLREHKVAVTTPLADYIDHEDGAVRRAARTLQGLRWLLVWPEEAVAEHIGAYEKQWGVPASE